MNDAGSKFLKVAAVCAFVGPVVLLASDLIFIFGGLLFEWTIGLWLAFSIMIPAVIAFTYLVVSSGSRLAMIGGILAFFGLMAGAAMSVLFRVYAVLTERGATETIPLLSGTFKLVASTQMIGLMWPLGLVLLAISYYLNGAKNIVIPLLLVVGAISFPIGRIAGSTAAVIISGVMFIAAFSMIGTRLLKLANKTNEI